jgi:hypothetical protein
LLADPSSSHTTHHHPNNNNREQAVQALGAVAAAGGPPPGQGLSEAAINWLLETEGGANPGAAVSLRPAPPAMAAFGGQQQQRCKMVLVVRTDLGMSPGKIAAQCVHGAWHLGGVREEGASKTRSSSSFLSFPGLCLHMYTHTLHA